MRKPYTAIPAAEDDPLVRKDGKIWLPILSVKLIRTHLYTPSILAVVDSGSPCCIFRFDLAEILGLDIASGEVGSMAGIIAGAGAKIYYHNVKLQVESDWVVAIKAGFMRELPVVGLLGRKGFFENFKVLFDHSVHPPEVEITRIAPVI